MLKPKGGGGNSHQRNVARTAETSEQQPPSNPPSDMPAKEMDSRKESHKKHPAVTYLESIGGGLSLLGMVSAFPQFTEFYWYGISAFYIGIAALALGALLERWKLAFRVGVCIAWIAIAVSVRRFGYARQTTARWTNPARPDAKCFY